MALSKSATKITPKSTPITIYLSSLLNFGVTAGDGCPFAVGGAADVKSNDIIEISDPNNPKIDTHNDISVISFEFWCDGGRRVSFGRRRGGGRKI